MKSTGVVSQLFSQSLVQDRSYWILREIVSTIIGNEQLVQHQPGDSVSICLATWLERLCCAEFGLTFCPEYVFTGFQLHVGSGRQSQCASLSLHLFLPVPTLRYQSTVHVSITILLLYRDEVEAELGLTVCMGYGDR